MEIKSKAGVENLAADHLSRKEKPSLEVQEEKDIIDAFLEEHLYVITGMKEVEVT